MNFADKPDFRGKTVALLSLGCKVNSYETDGIRRQFEELGAGIVDFDAACRGEEGCRADIFVINTCSVTNIADRKSRQMLHRARQNNPGALIVATGCYAQLAGQELIDSGCADIVVGNNRKSELIEAVYNRGREQVFVSGMDKGLEFEETAIDSCDERVRAFIKIEDGCNQFCTYCIIPYARGRVRSRSEESIIAEVEGLAARGYREVVLTGIHISSYGMTNYEEGRFDCKPLLGLIRRVAAVEGIRRIRLGSLEPRIITREFAEALASEPKFCPYFHISLQSGCDTVLRRMNRHYTTADFEERIGILREVFDRPSINTDVIVGFPQETEEEFEASREFLRRIDFAKMHIFKYSRRKGTVADRMDGQLTDAGKHARSEVLAAMDAANHHAFMAGFIGEEEEILVESLTGTDGAEYYEGLTTRYVSVAVPASEFDADPVNTFVKVILTGFADDGHLLGHRCTPEK